MFTNDETNTLKGLFFAAANTPASTNPVVYRRVFDENLSDYFNAYPNSDENGDNFSSGDFISDES